VAICRRGETAEHGDDLDHDRKTPSLLPFLFAGPGVGSDVSGEAVR
jgi:hypothetical protein